MVSHLLGKKSWNVYNADNIARVRRDEEAAAAAERAAEQRMQEVDAARRLAILRGETPPPLPDPNPEPEVPANSDPSSNRNKTSAPRHKKRKRAGEDDTDFEMRVARERAEEGERVRGELVAGHPRANQKQVEAEIIGRDGHINLVGAPPKATGTEKNPEYEREAAKKKRELEDQYTMRFSNAAGRDGFAAGDPWYAKSDARTPAVAAATRAELEAEVGMEAPTKNVWGNEDPRRKVREAQRLTSSDPLAMMKMGAKKVREVGVERKREAEEREKELRELRREERRQEKRSRRERRDDDDDRRQRPDRSEHSRRRHDDDGRGERRHRHRSERERSRDRHRDATKKSERDHTRSRDRERHDVALRDYRSKADTV